jgi:DNA-binding transcriptional ArsR family regulator
MGVTRTDLHDEADLAIAAMAKALAHPARIAIIRCLLASRSCITGDLSEQIGLAQPTISQHLKELRQIGIIQGSISGTSVNYCINPVRWQEIGETFTALFAAFPQTDTCC